MDFSHCELQPCVYTEETGFVPQEERKLVGIHCLLCPEHLPFDRRLADLRKLRGCPTCMRLSAMTIPECGALEAVQEFGEGQVENVLFEPEREHLALLYGMPVVLRFLCVRFCHLSALAGRLGSCRGTRGSLGLLLYEAGYSCPSHRGKRDHSPARRSGRAPSFLSLGPQLRQLWLGAPQGMCDFPAPRSVPVLSCHHEQTNDRLCLQWSAQYSDVHIRFPGGYPTHWSRGQTRELFRQYFSGQVDDEYKAYIYRPNEDWLAKFKALHARFDQPDKRTRLPPPLPADAAMQLA